MSNSYSENEYKFKLPIGDWSLDGHNQCEYFYIKSNKPVEEVAKIYKSLNDECKIGTQLSEYEQDRFDEEFINFCYDNYDVDVLEYCYDDESINSDGLARLILDLIMYKSNNDLTLEIVDEDIPLLNSSLDFPIQLPGYGLFR